MSYIGEQIDPIVFIRTQFSSANGSIITDNLQPPQTLQFITTFPEATNQLPCVVIKEQGAEIQWLTIGATRQRWYSTINLEIYELNPSARYYVERAIRDRIFAIQQQQLAPNYIFMWPISQSIQDEIMLFGSPIYRSVLTIRLIFDITPAIA